MTTQVGPTVSAASSPKLSVVIPVFEECDVIGDVILGLNQVLSALGKPYEIVVVDDGSMDGTWEALQSLSEQLPDCLRVIQHPYNKGQGSALKTGIRATRGEIIACLDGDGQHNPDDLLRMLPYMTEYDLVVGARTSDYRGVWYRNLANKFYNSLASWLSGFKIEDLTSGYRLFRARVIKQYVHLLPARFSSPTTTTLAFIKGGYNLKYVPIEVQSRQGGRSKIRVMRDGWRFFVIILKIIVVFEPLRVFLPLAVISLLLAMLSTLLSAVMLGRPHVPNSAVLLFVLSVLIFLLGLVSEQIAALQVAVHGDSAEDRNEE